MMVLKSVIVLGWNKESELLLFLEKNHCNSIITLASKQTLYRWVVKNIKKLKDPKCFCVFYVTWEKKVFWPMSYCDFTIN